MARVAPTSGRRALTSGHDERYPDIFSPQAHRMGRWLGSFGIGLGYGYWAAANRRSGGPITATNLAFGFVSAVVFALLLAGMFRLSPRLPRELRAFVWFLFSGAAFGFLYNQTGVTVLMTIGLSLLFGVAIGVMVFYWVYTHEGYGRGGGRGPGSSQGAGPGAGPGSGPGATGSGAL